MKTTTNEQKDDGKLRFMAYMRVGRLPQQSALMDEQRTMIQEFAQQAGGVIARTWEVEGGADSQADQAAKQEMLDFAKENAGKLDGLLVCGMDQLTRMGSEVAFALAAELKAVGVKIVFLPNVQDPAILGALQLHPVKGERPSENKRYRVKRVIALLRASSSEAPAENLEHQKSELEAYARSAGFELDWLLSDGGHE